MKNQRKHDLLEGLGISMGEGWRRKDGRMFSSLDEPILLHLYGLLHRSFDHNGSMSFAALEALSYDECEDRLQELKSALLLTLQLVDEQMAQQIAQSEKR
jgi:hypothetical protein